MDNNYIHPLFSDNDKELALSALADYVENNNAPEYVAIYNKPFKYTEPEIPRENSLQLLKNQYGINIITMGNFLLVQDLFFEKYIPHISKYLDLVGVKYYFSYMRPSIIASRYIPYRFLKKRNLTPLEYWNPNIFWSDFIYKPNDIDHNIVNPVNIFYNASITFVNIKNYDFVRDVHKLFSLVEREFDENKAITFNIHLLPTLNPSILMQITKLIHKHF